VLDDLQRTVRPPDDASDARLMERFIRQGDEHAFASLLHRHGPMVLGVCRRVLGNLADAEDAFQATFLVLVRKARALRSCATVGNWLYGVAHRTALEARRAMAKRRAKEAQAPSRAATAVPGDLDDLRAALDQELARLPDRYRQVIVLCDLEGERRRDVARRLRCPEGTVASRLAKARSLLAARLARHGLSLSAGALAAALAAEAASASVPAPWLSLTLRAARHLASGGTGAAGAVSARVISLVEGVCKTMLVNKLRTMAGILLVVALLGTGAGTFYFQGARAAQPDGEVPAGAAADGPGQPGGDELRQEITRLRKDLQTMEKKAAALEARLTAMEQPRPEVLFRGKPSSFWVKQLQDRDPKYREEAVMALGAIAEVDHTLIPTVMASIRDKDSGVREVSVQALSQLVGEPAIPHLLTALKDPSQENRNWVLYAIGQFGPDARSAVPAVAALLKKGTKADRVIAAEVLGRIGPAAAGAVPALVELLKDRSKMECFVAATALGRIGPGAREAVPPLIDLLNDTAPRRFPFDMALLPLFAGPQEYILAGDAARALGEIGPAARAALPALLSATDPAIEGMVREAIRMIDPSAAKKK
jgi:RNA polymerase sigma factor (sigma-70 family)